MAAAVETKPAVTVRKGDLVACSVERTYTTTTKTERETHYFLAVATSCTRDGLVTTCADARGITYHGPGHKRPMSYQLLSRVLLVPSDKLNASPADILETLGTEPWPHKPECLRTRRFDGFDGIRQALAPYRV